ncbi:energy transducer TonB [Citromicrobium bathyomarinum]
MRTAVIFFVSASLLTTPALAADFYAERSGWTVLKDADDCSMWLEYETPGATNMGFIKDAEGEVFLAVSNSSWSVKDGEAYEVAFVLNNRRYSGGDAAGYGRTLGGGLVALLNGNFERDFSKGQSIRIYLGEEQIDHLSLEGTANAMAALDSCLSVVRTEIAEQRAYEARYASRPRDPFAAAKPKGPRGPVPVNPLWIATSDYSSAMIREGIEGQVGFRLEVSATGRPQNCEIVASSGNLELDQHTCTLAKRRARFEPAIDADGNEVSGSYEGSVNWSIPD